MKVPARLLNLFRRKPTPPRPDFWSEFEIASRHTLEEWLDLIENCHGLQWIAICESRLLDLMPPGSKLVGCGNLVSKDALWFPCTCPICIDYLTRIEHLLAAAASYRYLLPQEQSFFADALRAGNSRSPGMFGADMPSRPTASGYQSVCGRSLIAEQSLSDKEKGEL